jgi:acetyltransferase-like isoleucine patch superfamily enzyme
VIITELTKRAIPFKAHDAKRVGEGCFYLDQIVWLNGDRIELGDGVGFNYGCYVNGFGGLVVGDGSIFGPYTMIHTANHRFDDIGKPIPEQGWEDTPPVQIGAQCGWGWGSASCPACASARGA